jgi:hypothetical protein
VEEDPPITSLVQLGIENPLPLPEENFTVDDRNSHRRLTHEHLPAVGVPIDELILLEILGAHGVVVVLVVDVLGHDPADESPEVVEEPGL